LVRAKMMSDLEKAQTKLKAAKAVCARGASADPSRIG